MKVATIPVGSRNLLVEEMEPSQNTIAIADASEKRFFLNGGLYVKFLLNTMPVFSNIFSSKEEPDGDKRFGEVDGIYSHPEQQKEKLVIHGPLTEDLALFVSM